MTASRLAPLDALRGLAALAVAIFHYRHLAPEGARPFEFALSGVYRFGTIAVPLFYLLSGYIFFTAYARALGENRLSGREYFWLRASRLYPLHLVTLLVVAGLQPLVWRATGGYFVYTDNDLLHFGLNLGFLQFSWWDEGLGFNGPTWSLSLEAGLYVVFFAFARVFGAASAPRLAMGALCLALSLGRARLPAYGPLNSHFAEALACFFVGGCLQLTHGWSGRRRLAAGIVSMEAALGAVYASDGRLDPILCLCLLFGGMVLTTMGSRRLQRAAALAPFAWLGDISYSVYLWHFPLQLALFLASTTLTPINFGSAWMFGLYLAATLALATLSYRYFESPARATIRRWAARHTLAPVAA